MQVILRFCRSHLRVWANASEAEGPSVPDPQTCKDILLRFRRRPCDEREI